MRRARGRSLRRERRRALQRHRAGGPESFEDEPANPVGTPYPTPALPTTFQQASFQPPAGNPKTISYYCPATPGPLKVSATVKFTVQINGHSSPQVSETASKTVPVVQPTLTGSLYYLKQANLNRSATPVQEFAYQSWHGAKLPAGKNWPGTTSNVKSGVVPGIDSRNLNISQNQGTYQIEQIVETATLTFRTAGPPYTYMNGYWYIPPASASGNIGGTGDPYAFAPAPAGAEPAPFPCLDVLPAPGGGPPTAPWYVGNPVNTDAPSIPAPYATGGKSWASLSWADSFTDFVMFQAAGAGGIWVPEASFTWSLKGLPTPTGAGGLWTGAITATVSPPVVKFANWPTAWNDLMYIYNGFLIN